MFERKTVIHRRVLCGLIFTGLVIIMPHDNWPATLFAAAIATLPLAILLLWPYMLIAVPLAAIPRAIRARVHPFRAVNRNPHHPPAPARIPPRGNDARHA